MKKSIAINQYNISYYDNERKDCPTLLFIHGWGADKDNLRAVYQPLSDKYRIVSIDLPGFGESTAPSEVIASPDYMEIVRQFITALNLPKLTYIGHSFGGKVGILLASHYPDMIQNLILIDAAGLRAKHSLKWHCKVASYKIAKFFILNILHNPAMLERMRSKAGSDDYQATVGIMRQILVRVVNEDFSDCLPQIHCPTFLYWGECDEATPVWMAHKMNKLIPDSGLYIVPDGGHFSFLKDLRIVGIIETMVGDGEQ
ncbi:MAG: alpha/beta hydrolase [Spirochaetales bacterium]|nr:alpha/beta hydrolase [Spirochaetales bacterium]